MPKLNPTEITRALKTVPSWRRARGMIGRHFEFADFAHAMKFVNAVADAAEKADHHPDIDIRWNKVVLHLVTHSEGGLTERDFALARAIDQLAP